MADSLQGHLDDLGIEHFDAPELIRHKHEDWDGKYFNPPPKDLWSNIDDTILLADDIRSELGVPVTVVSGYRAPEYDKLEGVGSADGVSQHTYFRALDIQAPDHFDLILSTVICVRKYRERGMDVGLGIYPTFLHIDTGYRDRIWVG